MYHGCAQNAVLCFSLFFIIICTSLSLRSTIRIIHCFPILLKLLPKRGLIIKERMYCFDIKRGMSLNEYLKITAVSSFIIIQQFNHL